MKKSIFTLAFVLVAFNSIALAETTDQFNENEPVSKVTFHTPTPDAAVLKPISLGSSDETKSLEYVILQNAKITESEFAENAPIASKMTTEEIIAEDNKITESSFTDQVFPLDLEKMDSKSDFTKLRINNQAVLAN